MSEPRRGLAPEVLMAALSVERATILRRSEESCSAPTKVHWPFRRAMCPPALSQRIDRGVSTLFRWLSRGWGGTQ